MSSVMNTGPLRSWLFAPGDSDKKMSKAAESGADAVIFDLEDAVAPDGKSDARRLVARMLATHADKRSRLWVRINPIQEGLALDDLAAVMPGAPAGIMLPKCRGRHDAERLDHVLGALEAVNGLPIGSTRTFVLATETAEGALAIGGYKDTPRLLAMSWGAEDLATALGASSNEGPFGGYGFTYEMARSLCLVGAAAAGVAAIETIHGDFRDLDGLRARAGDMARAGWRGMLAIHPAQVEVINEAFTPGEEDIDRARRIVAAFEARPGAGTVGLDGMMLDRPHLERARATLAQVPKP